jgi:predicted enzyme related to lactoylglutathione lyase
MITSFTHHTIFVTDQDEAKEFYVNTLGFKVNTDAEMGDFRWLTVSPPEQPNMELILMPLKPSPMMDGAVCEQLKELLKGGHMPSGVFETNDCRKTYAELVAKGVEFTHEPKDEVYGVATVMRDPFGNWYSLSEHKAPGK